MCKRRHKCPLFSWYGNVNRKATETPVRKALGFREVSRFAPTSLKQSIVRIVPFTKSRPFITLPSSHVDLVLLIGKPDLLLPFPSGPFPLGFVGPSARGLSVPLSSSSFERSLCSRTVLELPACVLATDAVPSPYLSWWGMSLFRQVEEEWPSLW